MHLGNVFAALLSWLTARSQGGNWLLRIEDLDPQRSRREYALQLMDDLRWLGLTWDNADVIWQSQRHALYQHYLDVLASLGLTYPCYCTRADIMATQAPHESDGRIVYAGTCRPADIAGNYKSQLRSHTRATDIGACRSIRLFVPDEDIAFVDKHYGAQSVNLARHCGDFVLRRADGAWAYQLAVVVDDALMGVTEVVRGRDLLLSSPQQIYLYRLLGFAVPTFCHHPLLCNQQGQRLCKRDKSLDLGELQRTGHSGPQLIGQLAYWCGLIDRPEPVMPADLVAAFSWDKIASDDIKIG